MKCNLKDSEIWKKEGRKMEKMNVESFNLDHTKVSAPYVRLAGVVTGKNGDVVRKYDIRFKQPNKEHMEMAALHSIEHLMAEHIRNHTRSLEYFRKNASRCIGSDRSTCLQ